MNSDQSPVAHQSVAVGETPLTQEQLRQVVLVLAGQIDDHVIAARVELPVELVRKWIAEGTRLE